MFVGFHKWIEFNNHRSTVSDHSVFGVYIFHYVMLISTECVTIMGC